MKLNIIDMGSNAIRWALIEYSKKKIHECAYQRFPYKISTGPYLNRNDIKILKIIYTKINKLVEKKMPVLAVATGHFREKENIHDFIDTVSESYSIKIKVMTGEEEAKVLAVAVKNNVSFSNFMHFDLGGASLELNSFEADNLTESKSFPVGILSSLVILENKGKEYLYRYLSEVLNGVKKTSLLALTGGNSNFLGAILDLNKNRTVQVDSFQDIAKRILNMTVEERKELFDISQERVVKLRASLSVFNYLIEKTKTKKIVFPETGLREGLVLNYICENT